MWLSVNVVIECSSKTTSEVIVILNLHADQYNLSRSWEKQIYFVVMSIHLAGNDRILFEIMTDFKEKF